MFLSQAFSLSFLLCVFSLSASGALFENLDPKKLHNDKEVFVSVLDQRDVERLKSKYPEHYAQRLFLILEEALWEFNENEKACDLGFIKILDKYLAASGLKPWQYWEYLGVLRSFNLIDDIFYDILRKSMSIHLAMEGALEDERIDHYSYLFRPGILRRNNVQELYKGFERWPDENEQCSLGKYYSLASQVNDRGNTPSPKDLKRLNYEAYSIGSIDESNLKRLQVLAEKNALSWPVYIGGYLEKIMNAKNSMSYSEPADLDSVEGGFAGQYFLKRRMDRVEKLTRRKQLYYKYNPTQIVMLAQVLEKASMRMGVDPHTVTSTPVIVTEYVTTRGGETREFVEEYFLSPSEQFDFARKRLRKDMLELSGTKTFKGVTIQYEDIILAGLETGYITHHDLEYVVAFDDLWNPKVSPWKKYKDFVWSFAGTAAFYLPPPWNVVGAVGMVFINTKFSNGRNSHENHENPANIFN